MSARSTPNSRKWRASVLAVTLVLFGPQCSFPHHTFFEEDCYNGKDDDLNGQADCDDPACKQKVICVPALPVYWSGPVVVWEGKGTDDIPDCTAFGYAPSSYDVLYAGQPRVPVMDVSQICPSCPCTPSSSSTRCEARLTICEDSNCERTAGGVDTPYVVTSSCSEIRVDGTNLPKDGYYAKAQGPVVSGGCQPQASPPLAFPPAVWDYQLLACDITHQVDKCGERDCINVPAEPLTKAVCVYKPFDATQSSPLKCPAEYSNQLTIYSQAKETRGCSDCVCVTSGVSCSSADSTNVSDFGSDSNCGSSRFGLPLNTASPIKIGIPMVYPLNVKLVNASPPVGYPSCAPSPRTLTGSVTKGQSVEFCCTDFH